MEHLITRIRRRIGTWAQGRNSFLRSLYLHTISDPFFREETAVGKGIAKYLETSAQGKAMYTLRRNVHMIEKGLTMQPRRPEFATAYIGETIRVLELVDRHGALESSSDESNWIHAVLQGYFQATRPSTDPAIRSASVVYQSLIEKHAGLDLTSSLGSQAGPHSPSFYPDPSHVEKLAEVAVGRRSMRWFLPEQVPTGKIDRAIQIAVEAPTACNRQAYRFEVFNNASDAAKVAAVSMGAQGFAHQIPGLIVVIGDYSAFFDERDRHLIYIDSSLASMGLLLGLEAQGVASCSINWPDIIVRDLEMRKLISLEEHEKVVMLIAYGYADRSALAPASAKKPLGSVRRYSSL